MRRTWVLSALVGLLLPLPLVLLLGGVLWPVSFPAGPGGKSISPVLEGEARMRLVTYHRDCGISSECEPPLGCLFDTRTGKQYCTDSQCFTDAQCPEDQACRELATAGEGPLVRFCVPLGVRRDGERCIELPDNKESACAPGLVCGGHDGWCARSCRKGDVPPCPRGFFCANTVPEPLCLPTCERVGCPDGQDCIRHREGTSACAEVYGANCQQSPCPSGAECRAGYDTARPGKVWLECVERCGKGRPPCSAGLICNGWQCRGPCSPQEPASCMEGYLCKQHRPESPWACEPDW